MSDEWLCRLLATNLRCLEWTPSRYGARVTIG